MFFYGDCKESDFLTEAVKSLPDLSLPSRESQKVSGTDNKVFETDSSAYKKLTKNSYFDGLSRSLIGTANEPKNQKDGEMSTVDKSLQMTHLDTEKEPMSPGDIDSEPNAPGRTRTCNLRIRSPRQQNHISLQIKDLQKTLKASYRKTYRTTATW